MKLFQAFGQFANSAAALDGDFVLISAVTIPSGASVSVDNVFTTDYSMYQITYEISDDSANQNLTLRLRSGGTDATGATDYKTQQVNTTSSAEDFSAGSSSWFTRTISATTTVSRTALVYVYQPAEAQETGYVMRGNYDDGHTNIRHFSWCGFHDQASSYDGFTIQGSTATTFSGSLHVYGWRR